MRSAEKARPVSSCPFADRVARLSIEAFATHCPSDLLESFRQKQTVLAAILMHRVGDDQQPEDLRVVSFGVGTKTLSRSSALSDDEERRRLRDMHAEALARRGLLKHLYAELRACATDDPSSSIFLPSACGVFTLREGVSFHLYTSSAPCGNATIKRWAKGKKPTTYDLPETCFPCAGRHAPFHVTAREQGQVALLVKRDGRDTASESTQDLDEDGLLGDCSLVYPAGTMPAMLDSDRRQGFVMTCSDKIAKWNCLGLQGCLLSRLLSHPLYLDTIVVGRKFGQAYAERALCCRVSGFSMGSFRTQHPAMLCTRVKFDEGAVGTSSSDSATVAALGGCVDEACGARFTENRCFVWWRGIQGCSDVDSCVLNGLTGLLATDDGKTPCVSSSSLFVDFRCLLSAVDPTIDCSTLTLSEAKGVCNNYAAARSTLYSEPRFLKGWVRGLGK